MKKDIFPADQINEKDDQEKVLFYVRKTIENNWSQRTEASPNE